MLRVWFSTTAFANYIIQNTVIRNQQYQLSELYESDANNPKKFHTIPDHIKKILYLDAPDLIIEYDNEPICSIEISQEAGTGHNAFQRFPRIAASVENNVPSLYIYPEGIVVSRQRMKDKWDKLNPNIFMALERAMQIYDVPALLFYFPTDYGTSPTAYPRTKGKIMDSRFPSCPDSSNSEMQKLFETVNLIVNRTLTASRRTTLLQERLVTNRRVWMQSQYTLKGGVAGHGSPITATKTIDTTLLINYLKKFSPNCNPTFLTGRANTVVYNVDAGIRGDPYPGVLAALDYLMCRRGHTYEDRDMNLVLAWGIADTSSSGALVINSSKPNNSVNDFIEKVKVVSQGRNKSLLGKTFSQLKAASDIPRYYLHLRYGSTFTKPKEIRCYAYFADAILFHDGALWREG